MNGDFGASIEMDSDQTQQEPSLPSPAMRHCAPTKQPLKSESGKHWSKSKREALGGPSTPKPKAPTDSPAKAESGSKKVNMQSIYEKQISYKYLPLELASATTVKNSIAKNILFQSLGHGLLVIKYGKHILGFITVIRQAITVPCSLFHVQVDKVVRKREYCTVTSE